MTRKDTKKDTDAEMDQSNLHKYSSIFNQTFSSKFSHKTITEKRGDQHESERMAIRTLGRGCRPMWRGRWCWTWTSLGFKRFLQTIS